MRGIANNTIQKSRRRFLRQLGLGASMLPFLPPLQAFANPGAAPKRIVFWFSPNGLYDHNEKGQFTPDGGVRDFRLKRILKPLEPLREKLLLLKELDWVSWSAFDPVPNDHPPPLSHTFCADNTIAEGGQHWGRGASIDQFIAQRLKAGTPFDSLTLGVESGGGLGRLSYTGAKAPNPAENDPQKVFARLTGAIGVGDDSSQLDVLRARRKSVIDVVRAQLDTVKAAIGQEDRRKIEAHLEHLRAIETRLTSPSQNQASCVKPLNLSGDSDGFVNTGRQQMENLALALRCDLTRVAMFQWSVASSGMSMPWVDVGGEWHGWAHANPGDNAVAESLTRIGEFLAGELFRFAKMLDAIPEGNGSVLDNTVIVWTSEHKHDNGGHTRTDLPYTLLGSCGGALSTGRMLKFNGRSHNDLYVSLCHAMGLTGIKEFGNPRANEGPLTALFAS